MFYATILYLGISFYYATFGNTEFTVKSLLNTDGLTLLGIIITFTYTIMSKSEYIRYRINSLRVNGKVFDYKITLMFDYKQEIDLENIKEAFDNVLSNYKKIKILNIEATNTNKSFTKYYYRDIFSNINFYLDRENNNLYIDLYGGITYKSITELVKFLVLDLLDENNFTKKLFFNRVELRLDSRNSEFKISNLILNDNIEKYKIMESYINIEVDENTDLKIDNGVIHMNSINKNSFFKSYEKIKSIIIISI
ncbi:hypothetical protein HCG68_01895 [Paeniclostridium sordellii]|nr:hypothetical protein [Paeniclostridium sordellii]